MRHILFTLVLFVVRTIQAQVNVYECDPAYVTTSELEVNNAAYHLHKPCILMDFEAYEISNNYPKYVTASEFIHIKGDYGSGRYFHAGPYNGNDHFWLRIQDQESPYEVWALNYDDVNAIQRYKKLELGIKLEGELLDRINDFLHSTNPQANAINPFLEWELDVNVKFVHAQSLTEKWRDGFYTEEYEVNTSTNDWDVVTNDFPLRVRFAPPLNGLWNTYVSITYDNNTIELPMFSFNVVESGHPGYVKVHHNKRNLQRGSSIIMPIGHVFPGPYNRVPIPGGLESKMPWGDVPESNKNANPLDWEAYIGDIASYINQGGKYFKMVQTSYGNLIEFEELGNYYNRLHYAWEQDKIFDLCEENDVLVNFNLLFQDVIMAYGQNGGDPINLGWCEGFDQDAWDYGNYGSDGQVNECDYFPTYCYFEPGTLPSSMFFDATKMEYHKQRTRYYISRYGYSPQIYTWDLMSEPLHMDEFHNGKIMSLDNTLIDNQPAQHLNHPNFQTAIDAVSLYHNELSDYIKNELKDKDHLISVSVAPLQTGLEDPVTTHLSFLSNANVDILGFHLYSDRPDKWIIAKDNNNNGKRNTEFGSPGLGGEETSIFKSVNHLHNTYHKPVILAEQGQEWDAHCKGTTGNIIDMMTGGFCGIAGMHPWAGYSYGAVDEPFDDRSLWISTIAAEQHMNSDKVISTLDHWNGYWVQGRQEQKLFNFDWPQEIGETAVKELQYYIAESKDFASGYVRNRTFNIWTNRLSSSCDPIKDFAEIFMPMMVVFYPFDWQLGPNNLFVYPVEKNEFYTIKWYDYFSGTEFLSETYRSRGDGRFKLKYPILSINRPILWFSMEKSHSNRIVVEESDQPRTEDYNLTELRVHPNPFSDEIVVYTDKNEVIQIFSTDGQLLYTKNIEDGATSLSLGSLSAGLYFLRYGSSTELIKIVKQ